MDNSRKIIVLALMIAVTSAIEIQDAGSFPTGTDYQKERVKEGQDPTNYKKTYHKAIPGGSEHAEVIASNGPNSNSFSQTYSKHQSFGSADTMQSQSFTSTNNAISAADHAKKIAEDAMARHNAIMSSIQNSMGAGMSPFGSVQPKMDFDSGFDDWMRNHMRMMNDMMRMQNAQIQALQQLIASSSYPRNSSPYSPNRSTQIHYQSPKTVDGEAYVPRSSRGSGKRHNDD